MRNGPSTTASATRGSSGKPDVEASAAGPAHSPGLAVSIPCPQCGEPFSSDLFAAAPRVACSSCGTPVTAFLFPALTRPTIRSQAAETLLTDSEAGCFFHPAKKAVAACGSCGRFLCGICDLDWEGQHLCASCLDAGKKKGRMKNLEDQRTRYDQIALFVTVMPCLIPFFGWIFTCVTAPLGLYLSIRYWNAPTSLTSRSGVVFLLAILVSIAIILAWVWIVLVTVHQAMKL
jgi:hypothetical protein